jgi:ABC-type nickel/cobalt efflux system permease component RcnA
MSAVLVAALGVAYGAVHGVGPDHCAALASLLARDAQRMAVRRSGFDVVVHRHPHEHECGGHDHWHAQVGQNPKLHRQPRVATIIGGAFALSGVRALVLMLMAMIVSGESWWTAALFIACFGLGVTGAMTAVGIAFRALLRLETPGQQPARRWMPIAIALSPAVLGAW